MRKTFFLSMLAVLVVVSTVFAAQPAEGETAVEHESPWDVVFRWVNVAILFGGLGYLLRKPAQEFFETRQNAITTGLERARQAQENAQARMADIEQRLGRLSSEIAALRAEAAHEAVAERDKIVSEAKREVDRVVEQSRQEIERIARSAEREIKRAVADLVIDHAAKTLRTEMTHDDQKRVVVRFIKNL